MPCIKYWLLIINASTEAFRHRCGAWTSNPVERLVPFGRFDSYTLPPHIKSQACLVSTVLSPLTSDLCSPTSVIRVNYNALLINRLTEFSLQPFVFFSASFNQVVILSICFATDSGPVPPGVFLLLTAC